MREKTKITVQEAITMYNNKQLITESTAEEMQSRLEENESLKGKYEVIKSLPEFEFVMRMKSTVWEDVIVRIPAENEEQAKEYMMKFYSGEWYVFQSETHVPGSRRDTEMDYDSMVEMEPAENEGLSTKELYYNDELIAENGMIIAKNDVMISTVTVVDNRVQAIIKALKDIDADGETLEHIIQELGMTDQIKKQLTHVPI